MRHKSRLCPKVRFCMNSQFLHVCYRVGNIWYAVGYVPIQQDYVLFCVNKTGNVR